MEIGFPNEVQAACLVAGGPEAYARSVLALLERTPCARRCIADCADLARLGWRDGLADLLPILQEAASVHTPAPAAVPAAAPSAALA